MAGTSRSAAELRFAMQEVHFTPDIQAKLEEISRASGQPADKLVQDAVAGFVDDLAGTPRNAELPL
jgi:hypothetical protein